MVHNLKRFKDKKIKLTMKDKRTYTGMLLSFDNDMNLILGNTEEYRKYSQRKGGISRTLGLCLFRGSNVTNIEHIRI